MRIPSGPLAAHSRVAVAIDFVAAQPGTLRTQLIVVIDDEPLADDVTLIADVTGPCLRIMSPDGIAMIDGIDVGCLYYNNHRSVTFVLFNDAAGPTGFALDYGAPLTKMHVNGGRIVDAMRRRVVELDHGRVVRDEVRGLYGEGGEQ